MAREGSNENPGDKYFLGSCFGENYPDIAVKLFKCIFVYFYVII